ncbi:39S ribosomal protein L39, mitochondrial [Intoshia linei]|uniref:39S ribosomal protein L39, mitochondrial n=1 Tax=Intoshia linei TaxID=1819745 RepID=A0A177AU20_9BILA|nr:39S ribosomal protein L39, mitochondrial [Intoshia linei]
MFNIIFKSRRLCSWTLNKNLYRFSGVPNNVDLNNLSETNMINGVTNEHVRNHTTHLFKKEYTRQREGVVVFEKINVDYIGLLNNETAISIKLNKNISTPADAAKHIHPLLLERSIIALVNGRQWDMYKPFETSCTLDFMHLNENRPTISNNIFWKSCSFLMGHALTNVFKNDLYIELCNFPKIDIESGSFVYDFSISFLNEKSDITFSDNDLKIISNYVEKSFKKQHFSQSPIIPLCVSKAMAFEIFKYNRFKTHILSTMDDNDVTVYSYKNHVDFCDAPLMGHPNNIYTFVVSAINKLDIPNKHIYRAQGISIPRHQKIHYIGFNVIKARASTYVILYVFTEDCDMF